MVIQRFEPGTQVPFDGVFALVDHWGEPTGFVCECRSGERLPRGPGRPSTDPALWYVRTAQVSEARLAA